MYALNYCFLPSPLSSLHVVATSFCRLRTSFSPYLLHAPPSLLLHWLCVHQYLLIHDLCAPLAPTSPHCYLMYHGTIGAHFLPLLHVYYHAPYTCLSSISTGCFPTLYSRLDFLSNRVVLHSLARKCHLQGSHFWTTLLFLNRSWTPLLVISLFSWGDCCFSSHLVNPFSP